MNVSHVFIIKIFRLFGQPTTYEKKTRMTREKRWSTCETFLNVFSNVKLMGLCSKSFGPYFWGAFHLACLAAVDLESVKTFINSYQMVLPCFWCRLHFSQVLAENPIPDTDLFKWSVDVHNIVNEKLGKPIVSYEEALEFWLSGCDPEEPEPLFDPTTITLMILVVALVFAILVKNFHR